MRHMGFHSVVCFYLPSQASLFARGRLIVDFYNTKAEVGYYLIFLLSFLFIVDKHFLTLFIYLQNPMTNIKMINNNDNNDL